MSSLLSQEELSYYVQNYLESGFAASLNYYKTHKVGKRGDGKEKVGER
jgi:hypothetical protein